MPELINTPTYILNNLNTSNMRAIKKLYYFLVGLFYSQVEKIFSGSVYCFFINRLSFSKVTTKLEDKFYVVSENSDKFYYTNKRFTRMLSGINKFSQHLANAYLLNQISFNKDDTVIDCGSNVGELYPYFYNLSPEINFIAFEPDLEIYEALKKNFKFKNGMSYKFGLSDIDDKKELFIDSLGADTSLEKSDSSKSYKIEVKPLDYFNFKNVKLIKIDGEGHEEEILNGAKETLKNTKYVTIDHGPEKGPEQLRTTPEVFLNLMNSGFEPIASSKYREITLFKNTNF